MKTLSTFFLFIILCHAAHSIEPRTLTVNADETSQEQGCAWLDLYLYDSFEDGWNGAELTVYNWNYDVVATTTLSYADGDYALYSICIQPGCYYIYVSAGTFPSEITWYAYENFSTYLASGGAPTGETPITLGTPVYGCTDSFSCSYNSSATCDDGSCCYGDCLYLYMYDSYGDGWNGAYIDLLDNEGNYLLSDYVTAAEADFSLAYVCAEPGCYHIEVTAGTYPEDISWALYNYPYNGAFFTLIASGGQPPYSDYVGVGSDCTVGGCTFQAACNYDPFISYQSGTCCYENCVYVTMFDSDGDGWNGATYTLRNWKDEVVASGGLATGDYGYDHSCLPDGCYEFEVTAGIYPNEITWIYQDGPSYTSGVASETHSYQMGTIISGCTDACAVNYNPNANCAGECIVTCTADLDENGVVNVGDLLLFNSQFGMMCY